MFCACYICMCKTRLVTDELTSKQNVALLLHMGKDHSGEVNYISKK